MNKKDTCVMIREKHSFLSIQELFFWTRYCIRILLAVRVFIVVVAAGSLFYFLPVQRAQPPLFPFPTLPTPVCSLLYSVSVVCIHVFIA
jgi:hypothetical protein